MKKIVLTLIAMMAFTFTYAETKSDRVETSTENTHEFLVNNFDTRFEINVNMHRLSVLLDLNEWQMEAVEAIHNSFNNEVKSLSSLRGPQLRHKVREAVRKDAFQMQRVLNDKQFDTYMTLLRLTLRNRHL